MFLAEDIDNFYLDLKDDRFISRAAIYHQRFSTNTFPSWKLAQPFRMLAHNGEINTLKANVNQMKSHEIKMASSAFSDRAGDVKPVIQKGSSDSAALDAVFELLVRAGRTAPMAGRWVMAGLDRNGLRPLRYSLSKDGILAVGSETGMCPMDEAEIVQRGALKPGRMIAVDLEEGKFYDSTEIINELADKRPYRRWLEKSIDLDEKLAGPEHATLSGEDLARRQMSCGQTLEDLELILSPMAETGKESIGSMGDDTPLAVLSDIYRPLSHYFRQNFSQVTNPPIDPLRETRVMGLKTRFRNLRNILAEAGTQTKEMLVLDSPVMTTGMYNRFVKLVGEKKVRVIDCTFDPEAAQLKPGGRTLKTLLARIKAEAEEAVREGVENIVLSDEFTSENKAAAPIILCVGAVQTHLVEQGLRSSCSILVRSAECMDTHYFAVLIGAGATAVNAYMAQDSESH